MDGMMWGYTISIAAIFACICAQMAYNRGRSPVLGFFAGFIFGIFAFIYYLVEGDSEELRATKEKAKADVMAEALVRALKKNEEKK